MKRGNKQQQQHNSKSKSQPLIKIKYITNPIKYEASVSEFRALVQELTGQDADLTDFVKANGVGGSEGEVANAVKVAPREKEAAKVDQTSIGRYSTSSTGCGEAMQIGSDPLSFVSCHDDNDDNGDDDDDDDVFITEMMESFTAGPAVAATN